MSRASNPDYGDRRLAVWRANLRDRRAGLHPRANARMGYLRPPAGEGRLIWIKAGGSPDSVRLAVELLGAVRDRRLDVRLVLTFEEDYPLILEPRVRGLRKIGLGYGPCDLPRVVRRTLDRLQPMGLVLVDTQAGRNLLEAAWARGIHTLCFNTSPPETSAGVEAAYPRDEVQATEWTDLAPAVPLTEPADPLSLFVETQVDTTLKSLATGGQALDLWWWQAPRETWGGLRTAWGNSSLAQTGILFLSTSGEPEASAGFDADLQISRWDRTVLSPGTVVDLDDPRWYPAVASASTGIHLANSDRFTLWQALAGGTPVSVSPEIRDAFPWLGEIVEVQGKTTDVLSAWGEGRDDAMGLRRRGDACRKAVWQERRRLQGVLEAFLQRTFDW